MRHHRYCRLCVFTTFPARFTGYVLEGLCDRCGRPELCALVWDGTRPRNYQRGESHALPERVPTDNVLVS